MTERLLTARELAEWIGVSTETVLRWTRARKLPAVRLPGGALRYRESDIEAWVAQRCQPVHTGPNAKRTPAALETPRGS
jgi:excisionase family DNA binding protein